jgi:hypothetical protein
LDLRYTAHASERLEEHGISEDQVATVILTAFATFEQQDTVRYHAVVAGKGLGVVVKRGTFPPLIVTAFPLSAEWLP